MFSFAQNFEDVLLARIFRDKATGFYVDVGAHYPLIDSVTEHFYRLGWRGINIEPLPTAFSELNRARPLDVNLNVAVAEKEGEIPFFALDGFSTLDGEVAARHSKAGLEPKEILVKTRRLDSILSEHAPAHIDFLKIDVEGAEGGVVRSSDWSRFRPLIIIVEAIDPQTHEPRFVDWEGTILEAGYELVHFDGVNRWYWNRDIASPTSSWFLPPNALDRFTAFPQVSAEAHAAAAAREAAYAREHLASELVKISGAITALVEGDYSTPAPNDSFAGAWALLREAAQKGSAAQVLSADQINLQEALSEAHRTIDRLKDDINLLKNDKEKSINKLKEENRFLRNIKDQTIHKLEEDIRQLNIDKDKSIGRLISEAEELKREVENLQVRLNISEKSRLTLVDALSFHKIIVD